MNRRELLLLLGGATVTWPLTAPAQGRAKIPRIGYLFSFAPSAGQQLWDACRQGLRDLGYVEGQSILLEPRWAAGQQREGLADLAAELVRLKVDVIVAAATPASRAVKKATDTIPIVIVAVGEPVSAGLAASLARPGGNVTGLSLLTPELGGKRLELLIALRKTSRVAVLVNPENFSHARILEETQATASRLGITLVKLEARDAEQIERAFEAAKEGALAALIVFDDPGLWSARSSIVALSAALQIPTMYGYRDFVDEGGLISYGPDRPDMYRRTAVFVDKILKGTKPADLPIEQPTRFQLVLNLKAANALGLTIPPSLFALADEVIE
jgi:putative tryptophan/tyrosine transport system substrate-binding protein